MAGIEPIESGPHARPVSGAGRHVGRAAVPEKGAEADRIDLQADRLQRAVPRTEAEFAARREVLKKAIADGSYSTDKALDSLAGWMAGGVNPLDAESIK